MIVDNIFFFADPHFDHANIIRYCDRPFNGVAEMNNTILRNYREVVKPDSLVYFLGDMSFGRYSRSAMWWLERLTGKVVYIRGSHDRGINGLAKDYEWLEADGIRLLLVHNPIHIPPNWNGWIIHAHTHSTQLINRQRKRVCVGVEATGYKPIALGEVLETIRG